MPTHQGSSRSKRPEIARGRRAGRAEVLEELAADVRADLERLKVVGTVEDAERKAAEWAPGAIGSR